MARGLLDSRPPFVVYFLQFPEDSVEVGIDRIDPDWQGAAPSGDELDE